MIAYILLAMFNGVIIGISRAINSRLSTDIGPFKASYWNHVIGFIFLSVILIFTEKTPFSFVIDIPVVAYFAGLFGALFVGINSFVFSRIGAVKTILLVISGQMISSTIIDYNNGDQTKIGLQFLGVFFILFGVYLSKIPKSRVAIET